jgi:coenzyme F420-0:L-glutamate ligase/coenzyme F420-1:gamma-L-glutamate ligase
MIEIIALGGVPEIAPGDDLPGLLTAALEREGLRLRAGDVLVVTQKIVSKAENRYVQLDGVVPGPAAISLSVEVHKDARLVELVLRESSAVVRAAPNVLITRHKLGFVLANAGIDASNIGRSRFGDVLLLPEDPDASARRIAAALAVDGVAPALIISDSFGRPWRNGVVQVAIGAAGLQALIDQRGEEDRDGRPLQVTQVALADMIASAAGLVLGEAAEGIPAALVRGCAHAAGVQSATVLLRPLEQDLFR